MILRLHRTSITLVIKKEKKEVTLVNSRVIRTVLVKHTFICLEKWWGHIYTCLFPQILFDVLEIPIFAIWYIF